MKKLLISFSVFLVISIFFSPNVLASGFQLKSIGALDMDGVTVDHIWYSNGTTSITGIAEAYSDVKVKVDSGAEETVSASSDGTWIYHANLAEGDHTLSFTNSGGSLISKTLTIGNIPADIGALPKAETPTVGNIGPTMVLVLMGLVLALIPVLIFKLRNC